MSFDIENVPFIEVPLPSKGLVYPLIGNGEGGQKYVEKISLRPMTAKDENILHSPALLRTGRAVPQVIQNCIVEPKTIKVENLLLGDHAALMLFLRMISYGPEIESSNIECPSCDQSFPQTFNLGNLEEKRLEVEPIVLGTNQFEYRLRSGMVVVFRLMTVKDSEELDNLLRIKRKKGLQEDIVTSRLKHLVISIDGETDLQKLSTRIESMTARDSSELRSYMNSIEPDIAPKADVVCPSCAEITNMVVPLGPTFFWPERARQ